MVVLGDERWPCREFILGGSPDQDPEGTPPAEAGDPAAGLGVPSGIVSFAQRLIGDGKVASIHGEMTFNGGEGAETHHGGSYRIAEGDGAR